MKKLGSNSSSNGKGKKAKLNSVRAWNRVLVLETIREKKAISRYDVSKITGLNPTTVAKLAQDLINGGYITETGKGESSGGRKPLMLEICPDHHHFLIHLLGDESFTFSVLDFNFKRVHTATVPFNKPLPVSKYKALLKRELVQFEEFNFIGGAIAVVGTSDSTSHKVTHTPGIQGECNPHELVKNYLGVPTITENLTRVQAWEECSRIEDCEDLLYVIIDQGIAVGLILGNEIQAGHTGLAGEIGHTWAGETDFECMLGHKGCLESHVGSKAILHDLSKLLKREVTLGEIDDLVLDNPQVRALIDEKINMLATALAHSIDTIEPTVLVLAGVLVWNSSYFFEEIQKRMKNFSFVLREGTVRQINLGRDLTIGQKESRLATMLYENILNNVSLTGMQGQSDQPEAKA